MKTKKLQDHDVGQEPDNPLHANRPMIFITTAVLAGGIIMAIILKISPPDNPRTKPVAAKIMPKR